jgi:hypothetical protein
MKKSHLIGALCGAVLTLVTSLAHAVMPLESRLGGLAYYDPNLGITWVANANINGSDSWHNHVAWVASLSIGGVSDWRLASMDVDGDGNVVNCAGGGVADCADNEMGFLHWDEGITFGAPGPFSNVQSTAYWSGTEASNTALAWNFNFDLGGLHTNFKGNNSFAWAVHSGDVGGGPPVTSVPALGTGGLALLAAMLLGAGAVIARRQQLAWQAQ